MIEWLESNLMLIRRKELIFGLIWAVQAPSDGQEYSYGFNTFSKGFRTPFSIKKYKNLLINRGSGHKLWGGEKIREKVRKK